METCRLCFEKTGDFLDIFNTEGVQRNVQVIIGQHFGFQIEINDEHSKKICLPCWTTIENFHILYKKINEIRKSVTWHDFDNEIIKLEAQTDEIKSEITIEPESNVIHDTKVEEEARECEEECHSTSDSGQNIDVDIPDDISDFGPGSEIESEEELESEEEIKPRKKRKSTTSKKQKKDNDEGSEGESKDLKKNSTSKQDPEKTKRQEQIVAENNQIRQFCEMECDLCHEKLEDFRNASRHYRIVHKINGYLICCGKKLWKRCLALEHTQKHLDPNAYQCKICNKKFMRQTTFDIHMKNYHAQRTEEPSYKCDLCPKVYHTKHLLLNHKKAHREKSHCCPDCGKCFPTNYMLQKHIGTYHKGEDVQICDICARTFKTRTTFNEHWKTVHGDLEKVQCTECGLWLKHEISLKRHMKNHKESNEIHECNICGKKSPNKKALRKHITFQHKMKRLHSCTFCDKSFKLPIVLKEHLTTHTGEVLYTCKFCPKTFNSSANMHAHQKKKHPVEWAESKFKS